ncbi:MAG: ATP-binding protein [Nitrospirae bacterium]|nr:ATP-binding protein [Nitrospirota bacterium]MBI5696410.1 ATP-binding protein [Nitrospirota bacterium]
MDFVQDNDILQVLRGFNPWWRDDSYTCRHKFKRIAFHETYQWFSNPKFTRAIVVSGARRVGKTVILQQIAERLLKDQWSVKEILYLSLDHPILKLAGIDRVLDVYHQNVLPNPKRIALLLDEVQYSKDWGTWIKHKVDFQPHIRIIATGSAALDIQEKGAESGTGRWITIKVPTLSFYEYLHLINAPVPSLPSDLKVLNLVKMEVTERANILNDVLPVKDYFHNYLMLGGFPELVGMDKISDVQRLLREDVVDKVLKRDMTASFGVRSVLELEQLFIYLCLHSGGIIEKNTIASQLEKSSETVERFLGHLESANLIYRLYPYKQTGKLVLKGRPKVHISDVALRNAVLLKNEETLTSPEELGLSVESAVYKHFHTLYYRQQPRLGYWRDQGRARKEVDLVVDVDEWTIPVEVKYKEDVRIDKKDGLWLFMEADNSVKVGILVSKNEADFRVHPGPDGNSQVLVIPAFLLLYLLGHSERSLVSRLQT